MKKYVIIPLLLFVASCGNIPVPKNSAVFQTAPPLESEMKQPTDITAATSVDEDAPLVEESKPSFAPEKIVSVEELVQSGIVLLRRGQVTEAKTELYAALRKDPGNIEAVNLVHQINTDAEAYFAGEDFFSYEIQQGDTLSIVAKKYLNDPLKFFILAKYNDIHDSSEINVGRVIKVPGTTKLPEAETKKVQKAEPKEDKNNAQFEVAQKYYETGKYQEAIDILEKSIRQHPQDIESRDLLVLTYTRYAETLTEKAELLEAQTMLEKALSMQPLNSKLQRQLEALEKRRKADQFYQIGMTALRAGDEDKAYGYFQKAIKLQPNHALAHKQIVSIKSDVINSYHKKALQLYSKQQLLEAVEYWDRVLEIDPNHEMAKLYRARALELQERLNNL
jgi:tetratricopeptide (TPR) repeat protein